MQIKIIILLVVFLSVIFTITQVKKEIYTVEYVSDQTLTLDTITESTYNTIKKRIEYGLLVCIEKGELINPYQRECKIKHLEIIYDDIPLFIIAVLCLIAFFVVMSMLKTSDDSERCDLYY